MPPKSCCPSVGELDAFGAGEVDSESLLDSIAEHLETCETCLARVAEAHQRDRTAYYSEGTGGEFPSESECRDALRRIAAIPLDESRAAPTEIAGYQVVRRLGAGGMGAVYEARHPRLPRTVVLKVVGPRTAGSKGAAEQFRREIATLAGLDHPRIVKAYDAPLHEGREYLVMEYATGRDLAERVRREGPMSVVDACAIAHEIACGLRYLHAQGFVHRDIKPSNVTLSDEGVLKILDLGLATTMTTAAAASPNAAPAHNAATPQDAKMVDESSGDAAEKLEGTIDYMAPEQARGEPVGPAADLYALGGTLFHLLAGRSPLADLPTRAARRASLFAAARPSLEPLPRDTPRAVRRLIERLLARDPRERPSAAGDVAAALRPWALGSRRVQLTADADGAPRGGRRSTLVAIGVLLLFATLGVVYGTGRLSRGVPRETPTSGEGVSRGVLPTDSPVSERSPGAKPGDAPRGRPSYKPWKPGSPTGVLTGLAAYPPLFDGFARWQVDTVRPRGEVRALATSPDARHLALVGDDGAVRVWELREGRARLTRWLPDEGLDVSVSRRLAWSPDGKLLAVSVALGGRPIRLWRWESSTLAAELRGHDAAVIDVAWNPSGDRLASVGDDGRVQIWMTDGLIRRTIALPGEGPRRVAWRPDGGVSVATRTGKVFDFSSADSGPARTLVQTTGPILALAWRPGGDELAVVHEDHRLTWWSASPSSAPLRESRVGAPFRELAWSDDGRSLIVLTDVGQLVWEQEDSVEGRSLGGAPIVEGWLAGAWAPRTDSMWMASAHGKVREVTRAGAVTNWIDAPHIYLRDLAWNADSTRLAVCSFDGRILVCGGQGRSYGALAPRDGAAARMRCASWSPDGRFLAAADHAPERRVRVWDVESREERASWEHPQPVEGLAWSGDGRWVVAVGKQGSVRLWDHAARRLGPIPELHAADVTCVSVQPHSRRFASGDLDGVIQVWEIDDRDQVRVVCTWRDQPEPPWSVAWSPLGDRLAATGTGRQVWMLEGDTGDRLWARECVGAAGRVFWKRDGQIVYVNGLGIVEANDGQVRTPAAAAPEPASFSPDGRWVTDVQQRDTVTSRYAKNQFVNWRLVPLTGDSSVTFAASGQVLYDDEALHEQLAYVVELRRGEFDLSRPLSFERRIRRRITK